MRSCARCTVETFHKTGAARSPYNAKALHTFSNFTGLPSLTIELADTIYAFDERKHATFEENIMYEEGGWDSLLEEADLVSCAGQWRRIRKARKEEGYHVDGPSG